MTWYQSLGFTKDFVSKAVRVAEELPNFETSRSLGIEALYQIATLPPEQREQAHTLASGETKTVDEMTVRELREVKAELKKATEKAEQSETARQLAEQREIDAKRSTISRG